MSDPKYAYQYTNVTGINVNIILSKGKGDAGNFEPGSSSMGKFGKISRNTYPWTVYGVGDTSGKRVRLPLPSYTEWVAIIGAGQFEYTNQAGVNENYHITSWEGEKVVMNKPAP